MKCQKCGKTQASFHYSSNINGCVTETHLCSECAADSGYNLEQMFDSGSMMGGYFPILNRRVGYMPMMLADAGFGMPPQLTAWPLIEARQCDSEQRCGCAGYAAHDKNSEVDKEMEDRRELYRQMRAAAENEEFEKAAELRDKIREMEQ